MRKQVIPYLGLLFLLLSSVTTWAQLKQDSIYISKGEAGTTNFHPEGRSLTLEHDPEGRPLVVVKDHWVEGEWVPFNRRRFTYEGDKISTLRIQRWDATAQGYQDHELRTFNYTTDEVLSSRLYTKAPAPGEALTNDRRWLYDYDDEGRLESILFQRWQSEAWTNVRRQLYRYQAEGLLEEQVGQRWQGGAWTPERRRLLSYDPNHRRLKRVLGQQWSEAENDWVNTTRMEYSHTPNGITNSEQTQYWDPATTAWVNDNRQLFGWDEQAQFQSRIRQVWQEDGWQNEFRGVVEFGNRNLTILFDAWQTEQQQWQAHSRHQLQYNAENLLTLSQGWQRWSEELSGWVNLARTRRYRFFWSDLVSSVQAPLSLQACVVPNPYPLGTAVRCEDLSRQLPVHVALFDPLGRLVHSRTVDAYDQLAINQTLPPGLYLLRITQGSQLVHLQQVVIAR